MRNDNYINIQGWMVNELKLSGNDLLLYALIYGFSQDGESRFTGTIKYMCEWLSCSRPTVIGSLKKLTEKGIILKETDVVSGVTFCKYRVNIEYGKTPECDDNLGGSKDSLPGVKNEGGSKKTLLGGSKETLPYNTILDNKVLNNKEESAPKKNLEKNEEIIFPFFSEEFKKMWNRYLEYRKKEFKKTYKSADSQNGALEKLKKLSAGDEKSAIEIINQSISNQWLGLFELKNTIYGGIKKNTARDVSQHFND